MSSIGSIGSSSAYSNSAGSVHKQRPDPSKIADSVFSKLDTKSQGYLEIADLESAFSKINSGTSATSSTNTDTNASAGALFKKLDSDSDGKVTKSEFSTGLKNLSDALESQFNARRTTDATGTQGPQGANGPPPPPVDGDQGDGVSQNQLSSMASDVSKTDSVAGANLSTVAENFEAADTNQDGKVSLKETLAYIEKSAAAATATTSSASSVNASSSSASADSNSDSASNTDAALFKKVMQLLQAYADPFQSGDKSSASSISVSA